MGKYLVYFRSAVFLMDTEAELLLIKSVSWTFLLHLFICWTGFLLSKPPCWQRVRVTRNTRVNGCTTTNIAGSIKKFNWTCLNFYFLVCRNVSSVCSFSIAGEVRDGGSYSSLARAFQQKLKRVRAHSQPVFHPWRKYFWPFFTVLTKYWSILMCLSCCPILAVCCHVCGLCFYAYNLLLYVTQQILQERFPNVNHMF